MDVRRGKSIGEIVSALIVLSLSVSSATLAYMIAGRQLSNTHSLFREEVGEISNEIHKPWIHVVKLGNQYYLVIINPYDSSLHIDEVTVDNTTISSGFSMKPHTSMVYRIDERPSRILVLAGGEAYEAP